MVTQATLQAVRLFPELLPETNLLDLTANAEKEVFSLIRISQLGLILRLGDIAVVRNNNVTLRLRYDEITLEHEAGSLFSLDKPNRYLLTATDILRYALYSRATISAYQTYYNLWVIKPTIAEKLKFGISLTPEEKRLADKHNIHDLVAKGNLPLQWNYMRQREYQVLHEETHTFRGDVPTVGAMVKTLRPRKLDEFLVLTSISCERPPTAAHGTKLVISRDAVAGGEERYIELFTWPLDLTYEIECFIPAVAELTLKLETTTALTGYRMRFTVLHCKLNDILRIRWNLPRDVPAELEEKVRAGLW